MITVFLSNDFPNIYFISMFFSKFSMYIQKVCSAEKIWPNVLTGAFPGKALQVLEYIQEIEQGFELHLFNISWNVFIYKAL